MICLGFISKIRNPNRAHSQENPAGRFGQAARYGVGQGIPTADDEASEKFGFGKDKFHFGWGSIVQVSRRLFEAYPPLRCTGRPRHENLAASFSGASATGRGAFPITGLVQDTDGKLYGTTSNGRANGDGSVFRGYSKRRRNDIAQLRRLKQLFPEATPPLRVGSARENQERGPASRGKRR
jgi:hypothetical protein